MTSQEFCLKWNNHHVTLVSVLDRLLSSETLVDVTLVAEGKSLRVHRVVLAACSTYFQDIVDLHQDKSLVIFLKDVKYVELQALVDYMYRGEVRVAQNSLASLIRTAESLKIKGLAEAEDESQPPETIDTKPPDRDSPIRKRRRRSGDSFSKKEPVPPAPPLQPAPVIQLKEDEPLVVPVASTPRVVKQVPPPPPLAPAVESVHSSDVDLHNVESNSADFVKEYVPHKSDDSVNHGQSPVLPKFELSGDELGNDTDHGQEEEWNEEDFSALVSEQSGNAEAGEHSRSLANNSQQDEPDCYSTETYSPEDTDFASFNETFIKEEADTSFSYEICSPLEALNEEPSDVAEVNESFAVENIEPSIGHGSSELLIITKDIFPRAVQDQIGEPFDEITRLLAVKSLTRAILDHYGHCVGRKELKKICDQLMELSPVTFGDQKTSGSAKVPQYNWMRYLEDASYNMWRKMVKQRQELIVPSRKQTSLYALQPICTTEELEHMKNLKERFKETPRGLNIPEAVRNTYALQRIEINSQKSLKELKDSWPILFTREGLKTHFNLLVKCDAFKRIATTLPEVADKVYMRSCSLNGAGQKITRIKSLLSAIDFACRITSSDVPRQDYLWQMVLAYANELEELTIEYVETLPDSNEIPTVPSHPRILVQGSSMMSSAFLVIADGVDLVRTETMREAIAYLFATYWVFGIKYPKKSEVTFHFFMIYVAGFDIGISKMDRNQTRIRERCITVAKSLFG